MVVHRSTVEGSSLTPGRDIFDKVSHDRRFPPGRRYIDPGHDLSSEKVCLKFGCNHVSRSMLTESLFSECSSLARQKWAVFYIHSFSPQWCHPDNTPLLPRLVLYRVTSVHGIINILGRLVLMTFSSEAVRNSPKGICVRSVMRIDLEREGGLVLTMNGVLRREDASVMRVDPSEKTYLIYNEN